MAYRTHENQGRGDGLTVAKPSTQREPRNSPRTRPEHMRGRIVRYDRRTDYGVISGGDGRPYGFYGTDWRDPGPPAAGMEVDFLISDGLATSVTRLAVADSPPRKSRVAAAVLAILFGELGIHKFYLGYPAQGFILLFGFLSSVVLWIVVVGLIGTLAILIIVIIEFFIYLSKSDEEFHQTYVVGRRPWF